MTTVSVVHLKGDIETLELDPTSGPQIIEAIHCLNMLTAKVTQAVAGFDAAGGFSADHAPNMACWLSAHTAMATNAARVMCRQGSLLRQLPATAQAWVTGALSHNQVQAIVANLTNATVGHFAQHETDVIPLLSGATVRETTRFMTRWAATIDAVTDQPEPVEPQQHVRVTETFNGRWQLCGTLNGEAGALLEKALLLARPSDKNLSRGAANAAALEEILNFYLTHQTDRPGGHHRPHLNVIIDLDQLNGHGQGRLLNGTPISAQSIRRLLCDANIHRVITKGGSSVLDFGRSTRTISPALFTALVLRDKHCRFPGCERGPEYCDAHHVTPWEPHLGGGPTNPREFGDAVPLPPSPPSPRHPLANAPRTQRHPPHHRPNRPHPNHPTT